MNGFAPDSALVDFVEPARGYKRGKFKARLPEQGPVAIIVHNTGPGPVRRWRKSPHKHASPLHAAAWIYANVMDAGGHYVVGQCGGVAQSAPEGVIAHHVGGKGRRGYKGKSWPARARKQCAWWLEQFPGLVSPLELAGGLLWGGGSCNSNTVSIEVVNPENGGPWSDACVAKLAKLVRDVAHRDDIAITRATVLSHSEAHPLARTAKGRPYDPPAARMAQLWALLEV